MSWLTQIARDIGLGGWLDDIEAAEKAPSASTIGKAITSTLAAAPTAATEGQPAAKILITDAGTAVGSLVASAAAKVNPEATAIDAAVMPGLLTAAEDAMEAFLRAETGGLL